MACRVFSLPGGGAVRVCRVRVRRCAMCRNHEASKLCDGRIPAPPPIASRARTCSMPLCACCAVTRPDPKKTSDTLDYCPRCAKSAPPEQLGLGGAR